MHRFQRALVCAMAVNVNGTGATGIDKKGAQKAE